jgi:hypothetical protein
MVVPGLEELDQSETLEIYHCLFCGNGVVMHGDPLDGVMQEKPIT